MKGIILTIGAFICVSTLNAKSLTEGDLDFPFLTMDRNDTQTLLGDPDFSVTGFGGPVMRMSKIKDANAIFVGGQGAALFNDFFVLGAAGYGLAHPLSRADYSDITLASRKSNPDELRYVNFGYGGPLLGVNFFQKNVFNISVTSLFGAGGMALSSDIDDGECRDCDDNGQNSNDQEETDIKYSNGDAFFIAEPTVMLHVNVTRWFRIGAGLSYRYTRGINTAEFSDSDFRGTSYVFAADFGWF